MSREAPPKPPVALTATVLALALLTGVNAGAQCGVQWSPLGTGLNGAVRALATLPNNDVIAGGEFTTAGGAPTSRIARWDGVSWWPLGTGTSAWQLRCRYTPHSLRATTATLLDQTGVGIKKIQELLGHKDIRVTQDYIRHAHDTRESASHEVPL